MNVERLGDGSRVEVRIGLGLGSGSVLGYLAVGLGPKRPGPLKRREQLFRRRHK